MAGSPTLDRDSGFVGVYGLAVSSETKGEGSGGGGAPIAFTSGAGRARCVGVGESERRVRGKEIIRIAEVKTKML